MLRIPTVATVCLLLTFSSAYAQMGMPDQPLSNLQNGVSPMVAAARQQENDRIASVHQLEKSNDERAVAVRARLAEHDCAGARNITLQAHDVSLTNEVETLCSPPVAGPIRPSQMPGPQ